MNLGYLNDGTSEGIILLLGGNKLNRGILNKFKSYNYKVYVVDWNEFPDLVGDKHIRADVKDYKAILRFIESENLLKDLLFVYSSIDQAVPSVAMLNRKIGLKTISDDAIKRVISKSEMVKKWNDDGLLNRLSLEFDSYDDSIYGLNREKKLIIKPDNSASSRGITILQRNTSPDMIKASFEKAINEASNHKVVIEEFIEGTEYTAEMIGDDFGNVCVYGISKKIHTRNARDNRVAVKLHYNCISVEKQKIISDYAINCYKSLGIASSMGHLELIVKIDGSISPVEIGARSSGYIASDLVDIVSGEDYLRDLIKVYHGERVKNGFHKQTDKTAVYFFYDFPAGSIVKKEHRLLDFMDKRVSSRAYDSSKITKGNKINMISNDNERIGFEILEGPKSLLTEKYLSDCEKEMIENTIN